MGQVVLAGEQPASQLLHGLLLGAVREFPSALSQAQLPQDPAAFRRDYPQCLPRFEACRLAALECDEIAAALVNGFNQSLQWQTETGIQTLADALTEVCAALPLQQHRFAAAPGWRPRLRYQQRDWGSEELTQLAEILAARGLISSAAAAALDWVAGHTAATGKVSLVGRKIAVLGAAAEMAPTRHWLQAGAEVLWLDTQPPPAEWFDAADLSGVLYWPESPVNLLTQPQALLATLVAFAAGQPLDLGLYAYAPGQAREVKLTGVMNALVDAMPPALIASVTLLVSPTTPTALTELDREAMQQRLQRRPLWEATLAAMGLLGRSEGAATVHGSAGEGCATQTVVGIQGASYQAAQYLAKVLTAAQWMRRGAFRVSANTAAITRTRSLSHPVFNAAFGGAGAFGIETMTPAQSRCLNGLLSVHDWLSAQSSAPGAARIHGGIHTLPYALEAALRVAASLGFARNPRLLAGLLKR